MHTTCFCVTVKTSPDSLLSRCEVILPYCAVVCLLGNFWQSCDCDCTWAFVWLPWSAVARWQVIAQVSLCASLKLGSCSPDSNKALHKYVGLQMICKLHYTSWSLFAAFVQNPCPCKSWHWPTTLAKQIRCVTVKLKLRTAIA